jgi:hypothetical protein
MHELSALIRSESDFVTDDSFQSQSQGALRNLRRGFSSHLVTDGPDPANWWPADLGVPSSVGAQNEVRYAYFPATQRLAVDINGNVTVYDTRGYQISGFSQQQSGSGSLSFSSSWATLIRAICRSSPALMERRKHRNRCTGRRRRTGRAKHGFCPARGDTRCDRAHGGAPCPWCSHRR